VKEVRLNINKLQELKRKLSSANDMRVRVGLLKSTSARSGRHDHNPSLGLIHEFGTLKTKTSPAIPARSFIRMPLMTQLQASVSKTPRIWGRLILEKGVGLALARLGVVAELVIQKAFSTGGFGRWPKLSPRTVTKKGSAKILIETAQMRKAITSAVVKV
jgi:hypothetical protein